VKEAVDAFRLSRAEFSDCLALAIARANGHLPLATFDKNLAKLPDTLLPKAKAR
jgi:predicted nucleic acid-binding protein